MKIVKASNGKKTFKISKSEWQVLGKKAGWLKTSQSEVSSLNGMSNIKAKKNS